MLSDITFFLLKAPIHRPTAVARTRCEMFAMTINSLSLATKRKRISIHYLHLFEPLGLGMRHVLIHSLRSLVRCVALFAAGDALDEADARNASQ